jgi:hypothetical protein
VNRRQFPSHLQHHETHHCLQIHFHCNCYLYNCY